jgi:hypothetical protein
MMRSNTAITLSALALIALGADAATGHSRTMVSTTERQG